MNDEKEEKVNSLVEQTDLVDVDTVKQIRERVLRPILRTYEILGMGERIEACRIVDMHLTDAIEYGRIRSASEKLEGGLY